MTEKQIERRCINFYKMLGCEVVKFSQPHRASQTRGIADLRVYHAKGTWWHEIKTPTGKQSEWQRKFQEMVERYGETYIMGGIEAAVAQVNFLRIARFGQLPTKGAA